MALALAARLEREERTPEARIERAFQLAFSRPPMAGELATVLAHWRVTAERHRQTPPPAKVTPKPVVHSITSELTGERHQFTHPEDPAEYEANLHPSDVTPEVRAMADVALVLLNANEFAYVY
jgi:hypothetical protein